MNAIFDVLFSLHPVIPILYLILFALAVLAPAVYFAARDRPVNLFHIFAEARSGKLIPRFIVVVYAAFAASSVAILAIFLLARS